MQIERVIFLVLAGVALGTALLTVTQRNPIKAALFLIAHFFTLALLFLSLDAQFIAIVQVLVYAGAIMVLFLFVLMLLNLGDERSLAERTGPRRVAGVMAGGAVAVLLLAAIRGAGPALPITGAAEAAAAVDGAAAASFGSVESVGKALYTTFLVPFEATSMLLLGALVGVIVLARKEVKRP
jgi:NADH-quinone oxidoreductase subunit J